MMSKGLKGYALSMALAHSVVDAKIGFGSCPDLGMEGFDKELFEGDWYTVSKDGWS